MNQTVADLALWKEQEKIIINLGMVLTPEEMINEPVKYDSRLYSKQILN